MGVAPYGLDADGIERIFGVGRAPKLRSRPLNFFRTGERPRPLPLYPPSHPSVANSIPDLAEYTITNHLDDVFSKLDVHPSSQVRHTC